MAEAAIARVDGRVVGPRTKGLRLTEPVRLSRLRADLAARPRRLDDPMFAWPLMTLEMARLDHNIATMAAACDRYGVWHAPHVKTAMSADIWRRQVAAGIWGVTVAMPHQLRVVRDWGAARVVLANELLDRRELDWIVAELGRDPGFEVWLEVDSREGADRLTGRLAAADSAVRARVHPLIEVGSAGGRGGVRQGTTALDLAGRIVAGGLAVAGVIGYEGPVGDGTSPATLAAITAWVDQVVAVANQVSALAAGSADAGVAPSAFLVSLGGSGYLDITLPRLGALAERGWRGLVRAGAYISHDHGHYAELNPWARLPGQAEPQAALTVWAEVLSTPEPGLALLGAGRRDIDYDLGLPHPLGWHRLTGDGALGRRIDFVGGATVSQLNDQHAFLLIDQAAGGPRPGDVVELGISHPCTAFDKWQLVAVTNAQTVIDLYPLDF